MYAAAKHLLRLVESYVSTSPNYIVGKFVPCDNSHAALHPATTTKGDGYIRYTTALNAKQLLQQLRCCDDDDNDGDDNEDGAVHQRQTSTETQAIRFLRYVLLQALCETSARVAGAEAATQPGPRDTFIVYMVLHVYASFAKEAEEQSHWRGEEAAAPPSNFMFNVPKPFTTTTSSAASNGTSSGVRTNAFESKVRALRELWLERTKDNGKGTELMKEKKFLEESRKTFSGPHGEYVDFFSTEQDYMYCFFADCVLPVLRRSTCDLLPASCLNDREAGGSNVSSSFFSSFYFFALMQRTVQYFNFQTYSPGFSAVHAATAVTRLLTNPGSGVLPLVRVYMASLGPPPSSQSQDAERQGETESDEPAALNARHENLREYTTTTTTVPHNILRTEGGSEGEEEEEEAAGEQESSTAAIAMKDADYADRLQQALTFLDATVQVVPTCLDTDIVEAAGGDDDGHDAVFGGQVSGVCGSWLTVESQRGVRSGAGVSPRRVKLYHSPRAFVVAPGLAIAATHICSLAPLPSAPSSSLSPSSSSFVSSAGTLLISPASACTSLALHGSIDELAQYHVGGDAYCLWGHVLRPVQLLLLFRSIPTCVAGVASLTSTVAQVQGTVLIVIQSHVDTDVMTMMTAWGGAERTVVVVSSVGEWGLAQLALRFSCLPNTAATTTLRTIRRVRAGVLLYPLDETEIAYSSAQRNAMHCEGERRTRYVVVVGAYENKRKVSFPGRALAVNPAVNSMFHHFQHDDDSSSSSGSSSSTSKSGRTDGEEEEDDDSTVARPLLPLVPYVTASVLLGGTTPLLQREGRFVLHLARRHLAHLLALPRHLSRAVSGAPGDVDCAVMARLEELERGSGASSSPPTVPELFRARVAGYVREALFSYLLASARNGGLTAGKAWEEVTAAQARASSTADPSSPVHDEAGAGELYYEVSSAYMTIGKCLDTMCRTVLLGSRDIAVDNEGKTRTELFFFPIIES